MKKDVKLSTETGGSKLKWGGVHERACRNHGLRYKKRDEKPRFAQRKMRRGSEKIPENQGSVVEK